VGKVWERIICRSWSPYPCGANPDIYVNPTRVTLIRESVEAETLVEFEGDKREAIALPIEKVRELIDQAMSSMATTRARR
jgi:hypothetical protein